MRPPDSSDELERRRHLAGQRVLEGYPIEEVADSLGVHRTTVSRGVAASHARGSPGPAARPATGRPPEATRIPRKIIRRWLADKPTEHGSPTDLWTGPRVAHLIRHQFGVEVNPKNLTVRPRRRGVHPTGAPADPPRTRPGGDRRMVGLRLAADQRKPGGDAPTSS